MKRRSFLSAGIGLGAGSALRQTALAGQSGGLTDPVSGRRFNVLFLMSDQHQRQALGIDGHTQAKTPNLDAFARTALRFDNGYCTDPVCVPSRASLLTSLYTHNHKAYSNARPWAFEHKTLAHYFGRAGYMTSLIGKMHFVDAQTHGFDYRLGFNDWYQYLGPKTKLRAEEIIDPNSGSGLPQIDDLWKDYGDPWTGVIERDSREGYVNVGRISALAERDHFESFVARESIRYLKNFGKKEPFFLISSFLKPHDPFTPAERFAKMFRPQDMQLDETWGKVDLASLPRAIRRRIEYNWGTPELRDAEKAKQRIAMYYANLAQTDDCIGQVLAALRELDLEKNTIVVYTADHGEMLSAHGLWAKFVFYEPSVGVPLIMRVPGLTTGNARCRTPVSLVQMLPTLAGLCGVSLPSGLDGDSFEKSLHEPGNTTDETIFAEQGLGSRNPGYMIRRGDYKYCYYPNDLAELYDLRKDPHEMKNLALLPEYKGKVAEMREQLFAWHQPAVQETAAL